MGALLEDTQARARLRKDLRSLLSSALCFSRIILDPFLLTPPPLPGLVDQRSTDYGPQPKSGPLPISAQPWSYEMVWAFLSDWTKLNKE